MNFQYVTNSSQVAMRTYLTVRRANTNIGHVRNLRNLPALAARVSTVLSQGATYSLQVLQPTTLGQFGRN